MILVDYSKLSIAGVMQQVGFGQKVDVPLAKHFILNSLREKNAKYKGEYGELIVCLDDHNYWRKSIFPYYKAKRHANREESNVDWPGIFEAANSVRDALKEHFSFRCVQVPTVEADDVIATLVHDVAAKTQEKTLIFASDKDFHQLLVYDNVSILSSSKNKIMTSAPKDELIEKIIRGDSGDGIPNIRSDDDTLVNPDKRQKNINQKVIDDVKARVKANDLGPYERNWKRNESLISLEQIPERYKSQIVEAYEAQADKKSSGLFEYFTANRLSKMMESMSDFNVDRTKKQPAGIESFFG